MKRLSTLFMLLLFSGLLYAQGVMPAIWSKPANTFKWFKSTGERVRGMAYNPTNNHLYIATRDTLGTNVNGGIIILNGTTGDSIGSLNMTGITGGVYAFNRLGIAADGRLYTSNLTTVITKAAPLKIYTWADETAAPVLVFNDSIQGPRLGDALTVSGTGQQTYVYVSGNGSPGPVHVFKRSADTLVLYKSIVPTGWATGVLSVGPTATGFSSFWLNLNGKVAIKYDTTGAPVDTILSTIVSTAGSSANYFEFGGKKYVAVYSGSATVAAPSVVRFVDVTNGGSKGVVTSLTAGMGTNANTAAPLGEIVFNSADTSLYILSANNGYGKYSVTMTPPSVAIFQRRPFVPMAAENDTVIFNVLTMKPVSTAKLTYYGYRTSVSDQNGIDSADVTLASIGGIQYSAIVPASVNRNGRRILFRADVTDAANVKALVSVPGYFAGITKLAYQGGPREVDTNGVILHKGYGIRSQAVVIVEDSVFQVANSEIVLQDSLGGVTVFKSGTPFDVKRGNVYVVTGTTDNPTGGGSKFQFVDPGLAFTDLGPAPMPVKPRVATIKQLLANGEQWENSLVEIRNVKKSISSPAWPAAAASVNMIFEDASGDSTTMRIDGDTNIDGIPEPAYPITIVGVAGQFDNTAPYNSGYQWLPRDTMDIRPPFVQPMLPLTFDAPNVEYNFINFSGATATVVPNPFSGGLNTSPNVVKMVKGAGDPWAGSFVTLAGPVNFAHGLIFKAKVYMPKVGAKMLLKLENGTNGAINKELEAVGTKANAWEELTWDFSTIDVTKEYHKVVVIFDLGTVGDGGANFTYYFDDIRNSKPVPVYQDPKMMPAFASKNVVKVDGVLDEPIWNAATPFLVFGPPAFHPDTLARTVTNGAEVKPYAKFDTSYTQLKFARRGPHFFIGFRSKDKSVSRFGDSWEGDGLFMKIKNAKGVDKEFKLYYNLPGNSQIHYEASDSSHGWGMGVKHPATIVNDTTQVDSGYTAELVIKLDSLGFTKYDSVMVMINIFDPDGYTGNNAPWGAIGGFHKTWWGSEWGPDMRVVKFMPDSSTTGVATSALPVEFALDQNYPNPFNPATTIRFALPSDANVRMSVYDILGREVRSLVSSDMSAGYHQVVWDGKNNKGNSVASGMYIYRIEAGSFISTKKMLMLK